MKPSAIYLFAAAITVAACGDDGSSNPTCGVTGATQACVCIDGAPGAQTCLADGAWSACECNMTTDVIDSNDVSVEDSSPGTDLSVPDTEGPEVIPGAPTIETRNVAEITATTAKIYAQVLSEGDSPVTTRGVCYSTSPSPTVDDDKGYYGAGTGVFWILIERLSPDTTYYARAYATSATGTSYCEERTFRTSTASEAPTVTSSRVERVGSTYFEVILTATNDPDDPTIMGAVFSTTPNPLRGTAQEMDASNAGNNNYAVYVENLQPGTVYHVRTFARNGGGIDYGEPLVVTTSALAVDDYFRGAYVVLVDAGLGVAVLAERYPNEEPELPFGCSGVELNGADVVGTVGGGGANTQRLVSSCGAGTAAAFCNDRVTGSGADAVTDWFLPNRTELRAIADRFELGGRFVWSSNWVNGSDFAGLWNGVSGQMQDLSRSGQNSVRCVFYYP